MGVPLSERVVFSSVFESCVRLLAAKKPGALEQVRAAGLNPGKLQPAYPAETWRSISRIAARALFPTESPERADFLLGQAFMDQYAQTIIGGALMATLRIIGPRRAFSRVSRSFRTSNNYMEDRVTAHGPSDYELWLNETLVPYVNQGVLQATLTAIGARGCTIDVVALDAEGVTYRCRWE
ncbi:MAG: DUF2378 family protein [Myxococcaceae bacterium]|nr:DUF2378 family protein [Myxococcaceae bacterium]